jgi:serine/threonine protein kinase
MTEREIFARALEIQSPPERAAYLQRACGDDSRQLRRVQGLLDERENLGSYLEVPAAAIATVERPATQRPGVRIGRYRLLEQIGEGGMGAVWVAEQTEPVKRRVAMKLIKPGMDTRQVLSRFEAERQALALMDHPNIAKVFDGGMTEEGRPFFVMEYVKGVPITEYCDAARLSVRERLKLFVPVCQAVQHAHQKGVIHRDLKPNNILVCLYDGQPVPKVIDFGLAKAISQSLTEHTLYTAHGLMVGTPLYMSPEQAEFNNLDVDTRTDIYSLGVILYELLTGTTPLEKHQFKDAALQEILRLIKDVEPPKPSTKLSASASLPAIAAQRGLEPSQLRRLLRGELDWIVMKALEKERSRRYDTPGNMARDIERHFRHEPVEAGPPSIGYRVRKFVRRNRMSLATTALVAAAAVVGGGLSAWHMIRADKAQALADQRLSLQTINRKEILRNAELANVTLNRRLKLDESATANLNRIAAQLAQEPRLREHGLDAFKEDVLQSVLDYWDEAIAIDTTADGKPQGKADFYRLQRIYCLARAGRHQQASREAAEFSKASEFDFDLARIHAICANAADQKALLERYADRAMSYLNQADQAYFFTEPVNVQRLASDPDLAALRTRQDFQQFLDTVQARKK